MPNPHRTPTSDPDERGMWLRHRSAPERFPTFAGVLPVMEADLSVGDEPTEEVTLTAVSEALQTRNREGITLEPAPERSPRATRRPRPSPLFGEGEIDSPYPMRATQHMEGRQSTLWETELTDPGMDSAALSAPAWVPHTHDESITLEVDPQWRAQIRTLDAEYAHEARGLHSDAPATDELGTDDLVWDEDDARNRLQLQTLRPSPLPSTPPPVGTPALARRAPLPRSYVPAPAPLPTLPQVSYGQRAVHAIEATAWFTLGALVFSGTGAATSLLVVAMLFTG